MPKIDLQNQAGSPSSNNLTNEYTKYQELYNKLSRTTTGQTSYTSTSSNQTYNTIDYPSDATVYNKGEDGLLNLFKTYILKDSLWLAVDANGKLDKNADTLESYSEKMSASTPTGGSTLTLDLSVQNVYNVTPSGNFTLAFSNVPTTGKAVSFTVIINQGATAYSVTFPSSVKFSNDVVPDISAINKTSILNFFSINGGARWYCVVSNNFTT